LAQGSLLKLAAGAGSHGADQFDHYTAVMLLGIAWMFDGIPDDIEPGCSGIQPTWSEKSPSYPSNSIADERTT
jgi:hypothetical protein